MLASKFRFTGFDLAGPNLQLSGLQLLLASGAPVAVASVAASHAPASGSVDALIDGNAGTGCAFRAADVRQPSFAIELTLSAEADVAEARAQGAGRVDFMLSGDGGPALLWQQIYETRHTQDWYRATAYVVPSPASVFRCLAQSTLWPAGANLSLVTGPAPDGEARLLLDARYSNGASSYMRRLPLNTGDFAIESWVKVDQYFGGGVDNDRMIIGSFESPTFVLFLTNDVGYVALFDGSTQHTNPVAKPAQQWIHVAAVRRAGVLRLFLDGVSKYERSYTANLYDTGGWWQLFGNGGNRNLGGQVADLKISTYAKYWDDFTPKFAVEPNIPAQAWCVPTQDLAAPSALPHGALDTAMLRHGVFRVYEFVGDGRIEGTVARKVQPTNLPLRRRVRLHRSRDGMLVRETWSKPDGSYAFPEISRRCEYDVVAWDHEMSLRSVIANNVQAEVMP